MTDAPREKREQQQHDPVTTGGVRMAAVAAAMRAVKADGKPDKDAEEAEKEIPAFLRAA